MQSAVTHFAVIKGKEREFEKTFNSLQSEVVRSEPGTVGFQLYRSSDTARDYMLIAHFRDESAEQAHAGGRMKLRGRELYALCEGTPKMAIWRAL
jgi:quinol monooxygenase YgiN